MAHTPSNVEFMSLARADGFVRKCCVCFIAVRFETLVRLFPGLGSALRLI